MAASSTCLVCGGVIELGAYSVPEGVIARGDRLMHEGCVIDSEADSRECIVRPAYLLPRDW